jgi:RecA/RadA recombinase
MELLKTIKQNESTVRIVSTVALAAIALRSFINGNRLRGLAAAGGAVAVGTTASTLEPTELDVLSETEDSVTASTIEAGAMQCPICNDPIVPGESRRPNAVDEIVHEACL